MIAALLLAAGHSRRFGASKLLQELKGKPVIRWSVESLAAPPIDDVIVVIPTGHAEIKHALHGSAVRFVENTQADLGMGSSIACGVLAVSPRTTAVLIALADEPTLGRDAVARVVGRYREGGAPIVAPSYDGVRGHPVLFDRAVFAELATLTGDRGARDVVDSDPKRVAHLELGTPKPIDIDTPQDLALLRDRAQNTSPSSSKRK